MVGRRADEVGGELDNVFSVPDDGVPVKRESRCALPLDDLGGLG
jgi:hypothetical protein